MKRPDFTVRVSDFTTSIEEWDRAQRAPRSELPNLSAEQKDVARKFGITEEEYARSVLAGRYGNERMNTRAQHLGEEVQRVLGTLGDGRYRVVAVTAEMFKGRWVVGIEAQGRVVNVAIPRELADDVLDSYTTDDLGKLKEKLLSALESTEAIERR